MSTTTSTSSKMGIFFFFYFCRLHWSFVYSTYYSDYNKEDWGQDHVGRLYGACVSATGCDDVFPQWNSQIPANSTKERCHNAFIVLYGLHAGCKSMTQDKDNLRVFSFGIAEHDSDHAGAYIIHPKAQPRTIMVPENTTQRRCWHLLVTGKIISPYFLFSILTLAVGMFFLLDYTDPCFTESLLTMATTTTTTRRAGIRETWAGAQDKDMSRASGTFFLFLS